MQAYPRRSAATWSASITASRTRTRRRSRCRRPRPTYTQDWASYNLAQTNEKDHFQILLADLCRGIVQPPPKGGSKGGRPAMPLADAVFSAVFKVYALVSARRFMSDLREALDRGHVGQVLCYNSVLRVLESPDVTPILTDLIRQSSLPLRAVESQFAIDSSGFSTCRYVKWFDEKYGVNQPARRSGSRRTCASARKRRSSRPFSWTKRTPATVRNSTR